MNNQLEIGLFGRLSIRCGSAEFTSFTTKKAAELFVLLALRAGQPVSRKDCIAVLWPRSQGPKAANRLSATLYGIRSALEQQLGFGAAEQIRSRDGSILLAGETVIDLAGAEEAWQEFRRATTDAAREASAARFIALYRGHLAAELDGTWLEPTRALWASRWTECVLWRARETNDRDTALAILSSVTPTLPVTRSMVIRYLEDSGKSELADSWRDDHSIERALIPAGGDGTRPRPGRKIFGVPTTTFLMVKGIERTELEPLANDSGTALVALGDGGYAVPLKNPVAARLAASRLRVLNRKATIYISTRVCDPNDEVPVALVDRYRQVRSGETLLNPPAATLIEMHEMDVVLERRAGRGEYRLL